MTKPVLRSRAQRLPSDAKFVRYSAGMRHIEGAGPMPATEEEVAHDFLMIRRAQRNVLTRPAGVAKPAVPAKLQPSSPARQPGAPLTPPAPARVVTLQAAAMSADPQSATAMLNALNYTADARERRRQPDAALISAVKTAVETGHCKVVQAMWDRCTWGEWKAVARATVNASRGEMRLHIFELSCSSAKFTAELFPSKAERQALTHAVLNR